MSVRYLLKFGNIILLPSWTRPYTYQGYDLSEASGKFGCSDCVATVVVPFSDLLSNDDSLSDDIEKALCKKFNVPIVGKSHDGGWPKFKKVECTSCGKRYVAYIGVHETSNSVYGITLQGVIQFDTYQTNAVGRD